MATKDGRARHGTKDVDRESSISTFLFSRRFLQSLSFTLLIIMYQLPNQVRADGLSMCDLSASEKTTKVTLKWTHDGSSLYTVFRSTSGPESGFTEIATTTSTYSTYLDDPVTVNTEYFYYIVNSTGDKSPVVSVIPRLRARNMPPSITSTPVTQAVEDQVYTCQVSATDVNGDQLKFFLDNAPNGMNIDVSTGQISWIPREVDVGTVNASIRVTDGYLCAVQCLTVNVSARLRAAPEAYPTSGQVPLTVHFKTKGISPHSTINWYRWDFEGDGSWDNATQVAQDYTYTYNQIGTYYARLQVTNMLNEIDTGVVEINVTGPPPVAHAQATPTNGGAPLTVNFSGWGEKTGGYIKYHEWDVNGDGVYDNLFQITPDTSKVLESDFESGLGQWVADANSGEMGIFQQGAIDYAVTAKSNVSGYSDGYIMTPEIDLTTTNNCELNFDMNLQNGNGYYNYADLYIYTQNDGYYYLYEWSNTTVGTQAFNLNNFCGQKIRVLYYFYSYYTNSTWQIDNIKLSNLQGDVFYTSDGSSLDNWDMTYDNGVWSVEQSGLVPVGISQGWIEPDPITFSYQNNMDCWVTSPEITLASGDTYRLKYWQYCSTSDNGDGGVVEISVNNEQFAPIEPVGGYPGAITGHGNGFTGAIGISRPVFDLTSYAGSSIRLRYHFYSDNTGAGRGWLIDSVRVIKVIPPTAGVNGSTTTAQYTFDTPGTYNATLKVTDNQGQSATASAMATVIEVGPPGSPTVNASVSSNSGVAPFNVYFSATATDPDGHVVLYEWDFDGDGTYDWSSTSNGNTSRTYTVGGNYVAVCQVTDNDGLTSHQFFDITVDISAQLYLVESDRTFNPYNAETMAIRTSQSGVAPVSIYLKDASGNIVRNLIDNVQRSGGTYYDIWDGRNDAGILVEKGAYYAILEYLVGNDVKTVDLTNTTGGQRYNPPRTQHSNFTISPYGNQHLPIDFTVPYPSEITLFMGLLWGADERLRTIYDRVPHAAGTYRVYWDGLTDDGEIPYEHSGDIIPGIWGYPLPDNAMWVTTTTPEITALSTNPPFFAPMSESCGPNGNENNIDISFTVSSNAPQVKMKVFNVETGVLVSERSWMNVSAGQHTFSWNGANSQQQYLDDGAYRIGFCATDESGNESQMRYNLMRTLYAYQKVEE